MIRTIIVNFIHRGLAYSCPTKKPN